MENQTDKTELLSKKKTGKGLCCLLVLDMLIKSFVKIKLLFALNFFLGNGVFSRLSNLALERRTNYTIFGDK